MSTISRSQELVFNTLYNLTANQDEAKQLLALLQENFSNLWDKTDRKHRAICLHCGKSYVIQRKPRNISGAQGFCPECDTPKRRKELQRVRSQNRRAINEGRLATLTYTQWMETLKDYNEKCAYCRNRSYEVIEHFIPLKKGGNTSMDNCVPACYKCNWLKKSRDPRKKSSLRIPAKDIKRVELYLERKKKNGADST